MKRIRKIAIVLLLGLLFVLTLTAKQQRTPVTPPVESFDVAVIKPSPQIPISRKGGGCHGIDSKDFALVETVPLGRCIFSQVTLKELISAAYRSSLNQNLAASETVLGGPGWASTDPFEVEAKSDDSAKATERELTEKYQALLVERFKLEFHRGTKEISAYALRQDVGGAKLKEAANGNGRGAMSFLPRQGKISGSDVRIGQVVAVLHRALDSPVIDLTNLSGYYNIDLQWSGEIGTGVMASDDNAAGPSIVKAVQEQLGLRLKLEKVPLDVIIIDRAAKPMN